MYFDGLRPISPVAGRASSRVAQSDRQLAAAASRARFDRLKGQAEVIWTALDTRPEGFEFAVAQQEDDAISPLPSWLPQPAGCFKHLTFLHLETKDLAIKGDRAIEVGYSDPYVIKNGHSFSLRRHTIRAVLLLTHF